jgi:hypothetical protein
VNSVAVAVYRKTSAMVLIDGSDFGVDADVFDAHLSDGELSAASLNDDATPVTDPDGLVQPVATGLSWTDDSNYPPEYIAQLSNWANQLYGDSTSVDPAPAAPTASSPASPGPTLTCFPTVDDKGGVSYEVATQSVQDFCDATKNTQTSKRYVRLY